MYTRIYIYIYRLTRFSFRCSSNVAKNVAHYGAPRHDKQHIQRMEPYYISRVRQAVPPNFTSIRTSASSIEVSNAK